MSSSSRPAGTLVRPPRVDASRAQIENVLELTRLADIGPDVFTNTRPLWHPPGARGIYGGAAIAMCLAAAQETVPDGFWPHSMHCYFVLAGDSEIPVLYNVERVREGRSFATRTVQARQRGKPIFTTTISFVREGSAGSETIGHEALLPDGAGEWLDSILGQEAAGSPEWEESGDSPFVSRRMETLGNDAEDIAAKRTRQWMKCRGSISKDGGHKAHLSALAYMSDSYFIGTIARVHNLWRFGRPASKQEARDKVPKALPAPAEHSARPRSRSKTTSTPARPIPNPLPPSVAPPDHPIAQLEAKENAGSPDPPRVIGMMVSLDHSIYFHHPKGFRADGWLFTEMESPWAGDGRGLVLQKIWNRRGELIATCVQEGVVRLVQGGEKMKL